MSLTELQKVLDRCADEIKRLKRKRARINNVYIPNVKNPLIGYVILFGEESLRELGKPLGDFDMWKTYYRELYFKDIRYRSELRKIKDRIYALETAYKELIGEISYFSEQSEVFTHPK